MQHTQVFLQYLTPPPPTHTHTLPAHPVQCMAHSNGIRACEINTCIAASTQVTFSYSAPSACAIISPPSVLYIVSFMEAWGHLLHTTPATFPNLHPPPAPHVRLDHSIVACTECSLCVRLQASSTLINYCNYFSY